MAPTLVVSFGTSTADERCGQKAPYEVICVTPKPATTAGEATTIGKIITEQGWTKVALVTSTFHLTRSRVLFNRCTATEIIPVAAPFKLTPDNGWDRIQHEWGGLIAALLFRRSC